MKVCGNRGLRLSMKIPILLCFCNSERRNRGATIVKFGRNDHYQGKLELPQEGEAQLYNAWATLAVIAALGLDTDKAAVALKDFGALPGRGKGTG